MSAEDWAIDKAGLLIAVIWDILSVSMSTLNPPQ